MEGQEGGQARSPRVLVDRRRRLDVVTASVCRLLLGAPSFDSRHLVSVFCLLAHGHSISRRPPLLSDLLLTICHHCFARVPSFNQPRRHVSRSRVFPVVRLPLCHVRHWGVSAAATCIGIFHRRRRRRDVAWGRRWWQLGRPLHLWRPTHRFTRRGVRAIPGARRRQCGRSGGPGQEEGVLRVSRHEANPR